MQRSCLALAITALICLGTPALAAGPLSDAQASIDAGDPGAAMLVIDTGAMSVNSQDEAGYTLLHYAAAKGSADAVSLLLARGADVSIKALDGKIAADLAFDPQIKALLSPTAAAVPSAP